MKCSDGKFIPLLGYAPNGTTQQASLVDNHGFRYAFVDWNSEGGPGLVKLNMIGCIDAGCTDYGTRYPQQGGSDTSFLDRGQALICLNGSNEKMVGACVYKGAPGLGSSSIQRFGLVCARP